MKFGEFLQKLASATGTVTVCDGMVSFEDGTSFNLAPALTTVTELNDAFGFLMADVENIACGEAAYGFPVENDQHSYHESVLRARAGRRVRVQFHEFQRDGVLLSKVNTRNEYYIRIEDGEFWFHDSQVLDWDTPESTTLGNRVAQACPLSAMAQTETAQLTGLSQGAISEIELDKSETSVANTFKAG